MRWLRDNVMPPRPEWNRRGPAIPAWWRRKLKRIDPSLRLQFMPPADPCAIDEGVNRAMFPQGCWVICRRLRRSRMLLKQWVWCLTNPGEPIRPPGMSVLRLIAHARNLWRQRRMGELEDKLDRAAARVQQERTAEDRQYWVEQIVDTCRRFNITKQSMGVPRIFVP